MPLCAEPIVNNSPDIVHMIPSRYAKPWVYPLDLLPVMRPVDGPGRRLQPLDYPPTASDAAVDDFHGTRVADPFRWLESAEDPVVERWASDQDALTSSYLRGRASYSTVVRRLAELGNFKETSSPVRAGERRFVVRSQGSEEQPVLWLLAEVEGAPDVELLNPNLIADEGAVALTGWAPNEDGSLIAYSLAERGGDWQDIRVRDVASGQDLADVLRGSKSEEDLPFPSVAWHPNGTGFFYTRLPYAQDEASKDRYRSSQIYWHRIGTQQHLDSLVFENVEDPEENFVPIIAGDGRTLLLHVWKGLSHKHQVVVLPLDGQGDPVRLFAECDARFIFMGVTDERLVFQTNAGAPRGRVIGVDITKPEESNWIEIVPEQDDRIDNAVLIGASVLVVSVRGSHHVVRIFNELGEVVHSIALPGVGTVSEISVDPMSHAVFMAFESYLQPPSILRHDLETGILFVWDATGVPFDFAAYAITHDVVVTSDGASVPITLVHSKDLVLDHSHPTILYGYGGFDVSITPTFNASRLLWLESGGIYAVVNIRGGGEFGDAWHGAGKGQDKQTVFDDFAAAGDWLITRGYTACARLVAVGESNGGLLVAATMLQRPELFAGVICSIPVTDMLRFHRFTIGHYWTFEYGNADADLAQFLALYAYSPIHNVRAGVNYPPILVTTGENDDRVVPAHAMKFVAALQSVASAEDRPRLLRYQSDVGHGLGKPRSKVLELDCAIYAFALESCGVATT